MGIDYSPDKNLQLQYAKTSASITTGSTSENSLMAGSSVGSNTIPGGWFTPGASVRIAVKGSMTTILTPGVATFRVKSNGTTIATGSTTGLLSLANNGAFSAVVTIQCYTDGPSGTFGIAGKAEHPGGLGGAVSSVPLNATFTMDSTVPQTIDITYQATASGNSLQTIISTIELISK